MSNINERYFSLKGQSVCARVCVCVGLCVRECVQWKAEYAQVSGVFKRPE